MAKKEKKDNFKVIIAGSRGFSNYKLLKEMTWLKRPKKYGYNR